jgi:hypothetical protein
MHLKPGALFLAILFLTIKAVRPQAVNRSIDDGFGDSVTGQMPIFLSSNSWANQVCKGCAIKPPISDAFEGTYTAATYDPGLDDISITFNFTGGL